MMSKHTPGPWEWTGLYVEADGEVVCEPWICSLHSRPKEEIEANARVMAAAPELLEALHLAIKTGHLPDHSGAGKVARSAIAKAEGRMT